MKKLILLWVLTAPQIAFSGYVEISGSFSYNRSKYTGLSYQWERRWTGSVGYNFDRMSGVEISYQNVLERTFIEYGQDTQFQDQILSVSWVQAFLGQDYHVQPYGKVGVGQLIRDAQGTYASGYPVPAQVSSVTGVISLGMRVVLTRRMGLKFEVTSYLSGGSIRTWQDNLATAVGLSLYL